MNTRESVNAVSGCPSTCHFSIALFLEKTAVNQIFSSTSPARLVRVDIASHDKTMETMAALLSCSLPACIKVVLLINTLKFFPESKYFKHLKKMYKIINVFIRFH